MNTKEKRRLVFKSILFAFLVFLSFYFDSQIVKAVSLVRNDSLNSFFATISSDILIFAAFVLLTFLFIKGKKWKLVLPIWLTLAASEVIGFLLKNVVQRQRPFQLDLVSIIGPMENGFSFPSLHAMLAFSAVPFLSKEFPRFKYAWIAFACLVAFSRIYLGVHFLSDVIAGALIGYLIGYSVIKYKER